MMCACDALRWESLLLNCSFRIWRNYIVICTLPGLSIKVFSKESVPVNTMTLPFQTLCDCRESRREQTKESFLCHWTTIAEF